MSSFEETNMCYSNALTPPSTPTEKITTRKRHRHQVRSVEINKYKINESKQSFTPQNKTLTTLDILNNGQLYSSPDNIITTNTNTNTKPKPLKPPEIALYEPNTVNSFLHHKHNKNTFNTNDTDDFDGESPQTQTPSSLCVTLYPEETETINEKHFTKTNGTPIDNQPIGYNYTYNDQLEGSSSESYSSPVKTGKLFTDKFPKIEYIKPLSIINDNNNGNDKLNDTPTTEISIQFPEPVRFERKYIPPPQNQKYNLYNPFGVVKLPVNWD